MQRRLREELAAADGIGERPAARSWTVVARDDGRRQWAYKGKPLYLWAKDQEPGDATGGRFRGVWHVAHQ